MLFHPLLILKPNETERAEKEREAEALPGKGPAVHLPAALSSSLRFPSASRSDISLFLPLPLPAKASVPCFLMINLKRLLQSCGTTAFRPRCISVGSAVKSEKWNESNFTDAISFTQSLVHLTKAVIK